MIPQSITGLLTSNSQQQFTTTSGWLDKSPIATARDKLGHMHHMALKFVA